MKRLLLIPLLLGFTSPVIAKEICTLTSEVEPDVTITLKYTGSAGGIGTLNYKNKPSLGFYVGIWNGYGGQYYNARSYSPELLNEEKTYQERTKNTNTSFWSFKRNVDIVEPLGTETQLFITINDKEIISRMYNPYEVNVGDELTFQVDPTKVHFFDKETEKAII